MSEEKNIYTNNENEGAQSSTNSGTSTYGSQETVSNANEGAAGSAAGNGTTYSGGCSSKYGSTYAKSEGTANAAGTGAATGAASGTAGGTAAGTTSGTAGNTGSSAQKYSSYTNYTASGNRNTSGRNGNNKKKKEPMSTGKKWLLTICMALVFGLVAGVIVFGINAAGNSFLKGTEKMLENKFEEFDPEQAMEIPENTDTDDEIGEAEIPDLEGDSGIKKVEPISPAETNIADDTEVGDKGEVAAVAEKCMPSVVTITIKSIQEVQDYFGQTMEQEVEGAGTGVIVGENDTELLIATNNHVISSADEITIGFVDNALVSGVIKGKDSEVDLAIVAVKLEDIPQETKDAISIASIGDSDSLVLGEPVVAIGNALGSGQSVTSGVVSALDREINLSDGTNVFTSKNLIQVDAAINSGNSGGALLNMKGELIGINEAKSSIVSASTATVDNMGYAIPISKAFPILEEMMNLETRTQVEADQVGYLGITCKDITADSDLVTVYGFPEGVCILSVLEGSPAEAAGAQKGDVITEFDGRKITSYSDLVETLQYYAAGEEVELKVLRLDEGSNEYKEVKYTITLCDQATMEELSKQIDQTQQMQPEQQEMPEQQFPFDY